MALSFGERVALIRRRRGLTQGQLATLLGVSGNTISRIEQSTHSTWGFEDVKGKTVAALARHLHISSDYLLGLSEEDRDMAWSPESATDLSVTPPPPPKRQRTRKAAPVV
jgi:transcriptional regulator with XRE-family HTH domain